MPNYVQGNYARYWTIFVSDSTHSTPSQAASLFLKEVCVFCIFLEIMRGKSRICCNHRGKLHMFHINILQDRKSPPLLHASLKWQQLISSLFSAGFHWGEKTHNKSTATDAEQLLAGLAWEKVTHTVPLRIILPCPQTISIYQGEPPRLPFI